MPLGVFACNWRTFALWMELWDRWLLVPGLTGVKRQALDLGQVRKAMQLNGVKKRARRRIYRGLLAMEQEALAALSEAEGR